MLSKLPESPHFQSWLEVRLQDLNSLDLLRNPEVIATAQLHVTPHLAWVPDAERERWRQRFQTKTRAQILQDRARNARELNTGNAEATHSAAPRAATGEDLMNIDAIRTKQLQLTQKKLQAGHRREKTEKRKSRKTKASKVSLNGGLEPSTTDRADPLMPTTRGGSGGQEQSTGPAHFTISTPRGESTGSPLAGNSSTVAKHTLVEVKSEIERGRDGAAEKQNPVDEKMVRLGENTQIAGRGNLEFEMEELRIEFGLASSHQVHVGEVITHNNVRKGAQSMQLEFANIERSHQPGSSAGLLSSSFDVQDGNVGKQLSQVSTNGITSQDVATDFTDHYDAQWRKDWKAWNRFMRETDEQVRKEMEQKTDGDDNMSGSLTSSSDGEDEGVRLLRSRKKLLQTKPVNEFRRAFAWPVVGEALDVEMRPEIFETFEADLPEKNLPYISAPLLRGGGPAGEMISVGTLKFCCRAQARVKEDEGESDDEDGNERTDEKKGVDAESPTAKSSLRSRRTAA